MIRGTTPTFTLSIRNGKDAVDLSSAQNVYVTISQGCTVIELSGDDLTIDGNVISCFLPQSDSLKLVENKTAKIQVNWTYIDPDGGTVRRAATTTKDIQVQEQLLKRVIT